MDEPVDLSPYLKKGFFYGALEALYRYIFQPLDQLMDNISARLTRKWVEDNTPKQ